MNKFKYYFILIITTLFLFSCSKDDDTFQPEPLRDFQEQFNTDNTTIEEFLESYSFQEINDPEAQSDKDVIFTKKDATNTAPNIMSYLNSPTFPKLLKKTLRLHEIDYEIYYLVLREGTGEKPTNVDAVLSSYKGQYISKVTNSETNTSTITPVLFEEVKYPQSFFNLYEVVVGWSEIFPEFRMGESREGPAGTVIHTDFGAGVMFLPSGLAYYNAGQGTIPSYTPLIFSFKLYAMNRTDLDNDGIPSYLEDINGDNYLRATDDSDGDGTPDYLDTDDDGDGFLTRREITVDGKLIPFDLIPDCSGNTTNADRKKKYLDKNCH